jgi:hypothetical protein
MAAMIKLVCAAHLERSQEDPLVTSVDVAGGQWAFCAGGAQDGHEWRPIEPMALESLRVRPRRLLEDLLGTRPVRHL